MFVHQSAFALTYRRIMFSMGAGKPGTFHGILAFQQRQASERCWRMVRDLLALTPCVQKTREERGDGVTRRRACCGRVRRVGALSRPPRRRRRGRGPVKTLSRPESAQSRK